MFIKKVKRPSFRALAMLGFRDWFPTLVFPNISPVQPIKKVLVESTQLRVDASEHLNPIVVEEHVFQEINDQRVCCFLRCLIKFKDTALKPFFVQMWAWSMISWSMAFRKANGIELVTRHQQTPSMPRSLCMDHEYDVKHPNTPLSQIHPHISPRSKLQHTLDFGLIWFWMLFLKIRVKILDKMPNWNHRLLY